METCFHSLFILLLCAIFLPNMSFQNDERRSIASINVTAGYAGEALTLRCEVPDVKLDDGKLEVYFQIDIDTRINNLAEYRISDVRNFTPTFRAIDDDFVKIYIASISKLPSTLTAYEISIVPLIAFNTEFSCRAFYKGNQDPTVTNKIPIVVLHPRPTFTGDNIVGSTNHPFNVTCSTAHFKELYGKIYTVKFYSLLDGQLARYEVDVSGRALLSLEDYDNVSISFGTKSKYPSFDLVITEKANRRNQSYWCEVDTPKYNSKSLHWTPFGPFVLFTSTLIYPGEGLPEERGTCTVEGFAQHSSLEYQVQFYSNLGPKTDENLLGHYLIRPNKMTAFVAKHHSFWISTVHGDNTAYPDFEIVTKLNSTSSIKNDKKWWCVLQISQPGQANYRLIRSNMKKLPIDRM